MTTEEIEIEVRKAYKRHPSYHMETWEFGNRVRLVRFNMEPRTVKRATELITSLRNENPDRYKRDPELFKELLEIAERWYSDAKREYSDKEIA